MAAGVIYRWNAAAHKRLVAMAAWDLWRRRRIHPAVLFGAAFLWTCEIIVTVLNSSPAWRAAMVRLVDIWGYSG